jgi:hypothetical protein
VQDFNFDEAVPCRCARPAHGGRSLLECQDWCVRFIVELANLEVRPLVKVVHWKGKHVIFIGPIPNPESVIVIIETIDFLGLQSKAQFLVLPDKPRSPEE